MFAGVGRGPILNIFTNFHPFTWLHDFGFMILAREDPIALFIEIFHANISLEKHKNYLCPNS